MTAATSGVYGDDFVRVLVREVQAVTDVELAFVAELVGGDVLHVFAFHRGDDHVWDALEEHPGPPLTDVLGDDPIDNAARLRERYGGGPTFLDEIGMQSAYAVPLHGSDGGYVGHLGLVDTRPAGPTAEQAEALRLLASRVAVEVERRRAERSLREARVRLVEAADGERRRLERNLHDGAQQRLVTLALSLRLLEARVDEESARLVRAASAELAEALEELRELARGIHPAVLTDRGLVHALESLAARSPVPVVLETALPERPAEAVEAAAYYVVAEALTNVAKYAGAGSARVQVAVADGVLRVEVADDGDGGAELARGSGLAGLLDRVEALGGRLEVVSPPGRGTHVRAELPARGPGATR